MKKLTQEKRLEYWKYQSAALSFDHAKEVADYLISNKGHALNYQLITSLYILYGRPFKQRKKFRLSEDIVPHDYLEEHSFLLGLRDKTFAHIDIVGLPEKDISQLNKILLIVKENMARAVTASLLPQGYNITRIRDLCAMLLDKCNTKAGEILREAINGTDLRDSTYEVDLRDGERDMLKSVDDKS